MESWRRHRRPTACTLLAALLLTWLWPALALALAPVIQDQAVGASPLADHPAAEAGPGAGDRTAWVAVCTADGLQWRALEADAPSGEPAAPGHAATQPHCPWCLTSVWAGALPPADPACRVAAEARSIPSRAVSDPAHATGEWTAPPARAPPHGSTRLPARG
jgi:hypothetical protein